MNRAAVELSMRARLIKTSDKNGGAASKKFVRMSGLDCADEREIRLKLRCNFSFSSISGV